MCAAYDEILEQQLVPEETTFMNGGRIHRLSGGIAIAVLGLAALGASLGGSGWRVPTVKEPLTIVDFSRVGPAIDPDAFPSTINRELWSSSLVADAGGTFAFYVGSDHGCSGKKEQSKQGDVRCVR